MSSNLNAHLYDRTHIILENNLEEQTFSILEKQTSFVVVIAFSFSQKTKEYLKEYLNCIKVFVE